MTKRELAEELERRAKSAQQRGASHAYEQSSDIIRANTSDRISGKNPVKAVCACEPPRSIRCFPAVLMLGPIMCGVCGDEFV